MHQSTDSHQYIRSNNAKGAPVGRRAYVHRVSKDGTAYAATVTVKGNGYNGGGTFTFDLAGGLISRFTIR